MEWSLRLLSSQCGSFQGSRSSQSTDKGSTPQLAVVQPIDPDLIRRLDLIEECLQPLSITVEPTHIHNVIRDILQVDMQTIRSNVIDHVTSHVTTNVVVEVAQRVSDIVSQRLNNKFIIELQASKKRQKKQQMMENRARDDSLLTTIAKNVRPETDG